MGRFALTVQDGQLLAEEDVLCEEFRSATREVGQHAGDEPRWRGPCDLTEPLVGGGREAGPQLLGETGDSVQLNNCCCFRRARDEREHVEPSGHAGES